MTTAGDQIFKPMYIWGRFHNEIIITNKEEDIEGLRRMGLRDTE